MPRIRLDSLLVKVGAAADLEIARHAIRAGAVDVCNPTDPWAKDCQRAWKVHRAVACRQSVVVRVGSPIYADRIRCYDGRWELQKGRINLLDGVKRRRRGGTKCCRGGQRR